MTPNKTALTTQEVVARFDELAQQEKWFDIHDELFADTVRSIEPPNSPYFKNAVGKLAVREKGENWVKKVQEFHSAYTTHPVLGGNHFAVGRSFDSTVEGFGRVKIEELMVYEVKDGQIVVEQFFY
ncbi:SnoaL-like domain-containing protein [Spirosoma endbachense]|uniref:Nuclear transport factor 2 family protein n=1 Tax=Spirosoma endbachense TaxID=2666025 RepID=A0A6P1VZ51_9BACT|nr:SnoaL-like domain-containing protein [Spirosoma endbachense]QHV96686.1 nuclear transport factor 2 family protein [Spirosoma endbachense]